MKKIHLQRCPVCGSSDLTTFLTCSDHYASGETFDIVSCGGCGFRFTQDFPDESEIGSYYETADYVSHSDTRKGLMNRVYHLVRKYMLAQKVKMTCSLSGLQKGDVLDIGCGTGYYLGAMKQAGWNTIGVEKSALAAEAARTHFGLTISDDLKEIEGESRFDVITLWHVMEHLQDLPQVFESLRRLLRPGGTLIVALPNSASYDAALYGEYWGAYDVPRHLWHFAPDTFARLAHREGFDIKLFAPMPFDAFYVSMLSEKYKGNGMTFARGMMSGAKAWVRSQSDPKLSSSIIYVLRKRNE